MKNKNRSNNIKLLKIYKKFLSKGILKITIYIIKRDFYNIQAPR